MRKLAVTLALASTALASPALARDKAWYVGVDGGATLVEDINYDISAPNGGTSTAHHKAGLDVDGVVGYDFGPARLEAEVAYKQANLSTWDATGRTYVANQYAPAGSYSAAGKTSALSFMLNALLDFGSDDELQGFVGGGVGVARVKADAYRISSSPFLDDSDTVFAWQLMAGVRQPLTKNVDLTLKYRFFNAENVKFIDSQGRDVDGRFRSHSILGGIAYNFGEPVAPPPPPPPPPPRRPPATSGWPPLPPPCRSASRRCSARSMSARCAACRCSTRRWR